MVPTETLVGTSQFAYLQETARTNNAAETAPGALKPTSTYGVEKVEDSVSTIAHLSQPVARQDLDDTMLLGQFIEGSLRTGVELRLDQAILSGNGSGENLRGLANTSGIQTQAFSGNVLTTARKALTKLEMVEIPEGVFVLSPAQWEAMETLQTADGEYMFHNKGEGPVDLMNQRLWGQRVIVTSALTGDNAYLVDFRESTRLYEREGVRIDWSEAPEGSVEGEAAFKSNELIFRGEGRFGFAVLRPKGVVQFDTTE